MSHPCLYIGRLDDERISRCGMAIPRAECRFDRPLLGADCPYYHGRDRTLDEEIVGRLLDTQETPR